MLVLCVAVATAAGGVADAATLAGAPSFSLSSLPQGGGVDSGYSVAVGDFTGNGLDDIAVLDYRGELSIFLSNGNGTFIEAPGSPIDIGSDGAGGATNSFTPATTYYADALASGDFTGNGLDDLAIAGLDADGDADVVVLLSNGAGGFTPSSDSPLQIRAGGATATAVTVADFNDDSLPDLAVATGGPDGATYYEGTVSIFLGNGDGTFGATASSPISLGTSGAEDPESIAAGNFGNRQQDLAVGNFRSNTVSILTGSGTGSFSVTAPQSVGGPPYDIVTGPFHGPGNPDDLAVALYEIPGSVEVLDANGAGGVTAGETIATGDGGNEGIATADFNDDGISDLAVTGQSSSVSILDGTGGGEFGSSGDENELLADPFDFAFGIAAGDFVKGGQPGIAVADTDSARVAVYLNTSTPAVSIPSAPVAFPSAPVGSVSTSQAVTLTNTGAAPLEISAVAVVGQDADEFKVTGNSCNGLSVSPGGSCTVGVRFEPVAGGSAQAELQITGDAASSPTFVGLSGAGLPPGTAGLSFSTVPDAVFAVGDNSNGQLGTGGISNDDVVAPLGSGAPSSFVAASDGGAFSLGLKSDGTVWAWGQNNAGQLGDASLVDAHTPVQVPLAPGMIAVSAGLSHSLALRSDGTVWAWGSNAYGQLGNGTTTNSSTPVQVPGLTNVVAIAAGGYHSLALLSDGTVWAWGDNVHGGLGNDSLVNSSVPVQVTTLSGIVAIAAGQYHSLALTSAGKAYAWGLGSDGQLGDGLFSSAAVPIAVTGLSAGVTAIAAGADHSLALLSGGTVDAWGDDSNGQLGNASTTNIDTPVAIGGLTAVRQIAAGNLYSLALNRTGQAYAWGQNNDGQLGIGSTTDAHTPRLMSTIGNGVQALAQGSEGNHTLLIAQPYATPNPAGPITFTAPGVGQSSTSETETVTDTGLIPLVFGQAAITGQDGDEFAITGDGCSNTTLAPGGSCVIGLRYTEKVSETNPVATLRIPSNSPNSPNAITLDPPTGNPHATDAAVTCTARRTTENRLAITCRLNPTLPAGRRRITITLAGVRAAVTTARRTITIGLPLPLGLRAGSYRLTVTTAHPTTRTIQTVRITPRRGRRAANRGPRA
jgi:hypothetical protein